MTLQQLVYIVELDQERHFARAAERCAISQPALTIQLRNLEEEIGLKIFDRSRVPLVPTPLGEELIAKARKVLREVEGIRHLVVDKKNDLQGSLTLGVIPTLLPYLVPLFIRSLEATAPKMTFTIRELSTGDLMKALDTGDIDVALMATPTGHAGLREFPVFLEPFVAYLHPHHQRAREKLYQLREQDRASLLLLQHEYCYNAQLLDICELSRKRQIAQSLYEINSIETLKNMVRADMGFAIVPWLSVQHEWDTGYCKPFKDPVPVREISLVVRDDYSRKLVLEKMQECIWNSLPAALRADRKFKRIKWNDAPYFLKAIQQQ